MSEPRSLLTIETHETVTVVRLDDGKANTLSRPMVTTLLETAQSLADGAGGIVVTGQGRFFSAGLNLGEVVSMDREALGDFIDLFERMALAWLSLPRPVVAAVNGHAIAGGAVLMMTADVRLMAAGEARTGFTEVPLGIALPQVVHALARLHMAPGATHRVLLGGETFGPDEARTVGMIDRVVAPEALLSEAMSTAARLARSPGKAYATTKAALRLSARQAIENERSLGREGFLESLSDPVVRAHLTATLEAMRAKRK